MTFKADTASLSAASFAFSGRSKRMVAASDKVNQLVSASSAAEGLRTAKLALNAYPWARRELPVWPGPPVPQLPQRRSHSIIHLRNQHFTAKK
jgi:hypothetical protein